MKFTIEKGMIGLTAVFLALALNAHAQQSEQPGNTAATQTDQNSQQSPSTDMKDHPKFSELDMDKDGVLTKAEAEKTWLASNFTKYDINQDGYINESEYKQALG